MKYDFVVTGGAGIQGKIVCRDLLENGYSVLLCDKNKFHAKNLLSKYEKVTFERLDVSNISKTAKVIDESGSDVVINCAEGNWNLHVLQACIKARAHSIDLSSEIWMTKKQLKLDSVLKSKGLIHITGLGSVPGIGNVMLRHAAEKFDTIETVEVGFAWDSNVKDFVVPFSMESIIEEFTDPALVIEDGKVMRVRPLDTVTERVHREVGRQKCFHVRHPETYTFYHYFKHMGLKNVRFYAGFPDHSFEKIKTLIDLGLGSKRPINFFGEKIKPIEFVSDVMKRLPLPKGYKERECLWMTAYGKKNGDDKVVQMECVAKTVDGWEDAGCNIDTGIPTSIVAQMIKNGTITERGSFAPEAVVPTKPFFRELARMGMLVYENGRVINRPVEIAVTHEVNRQPSYAARILR